MPFEAPKPVGPRAYDRGVPHDESLHPPPPDSESTGELEPVVGGARDEDTAGPEDDASSLDAAEHPGLVADPRRFGGLSMVLLMGGVGALIIVAVVADPYAFTAIEELVGFGLVLFGAIEMFSFLRSRARPWHHLQPLAAIVAGVVLVVWPQQTVVVAGYALAGVLAIRGVQDIWAGLRRWHERGANAWVFIRGATLIVLAVIVSLFPGQSVVAVVVGGAALAVGRAVIAIWFMVSHRGDVAITDPADTFGIVAAWLSQREMGAVEAEEVEQRVFLHRGARRERVSRFAVLMGLATAIATFGIATDSTAVVIGAMLVAPLMTPILGVAAGLINGSTRSAGVSAMAVVLGSAGAVALAWLLSAAIPNLDAVIQNGQVTSRTSPSLLDLAIALAAGAAGAYGVSRAESTDALPGVAVAIALVPPLAVAGITFHAGDLNQASGAVLLFLTNLFSIILMAGVVFVLVGYGSWGRLYHRRNQIRVSFAAVVFAILLITIPLALTAQAVLQESNDLRNATASVTAWLGDDTDLRIVDIDVRDDRVTVQLIGPSQPPAAAALADDLADRIGRDVTAVVRWLEESETTAGLSG